MDLLPYINCPDFSKRGRIERPGRLNGVMSRPWWRLTVSRETLRELKRVAIVLVAVIGIILVIAVPLVVIRSYFEAEAYNRLTGASATTWDAIWVELRVSGTPKD